MKKKVFIKGNIKFFNFTGLREQDETDPRRRPPRGSPSFLEYKGLECEFYYPNNTTPGFVCHWIAFFIRIFQI